MPHRVVVSTHLDDAVLSVFSVLGPGTTVVTVFAGFPPAGALTEWDRLTGATDSRDCVAERRIEDAAAIARTGAEAVHLDFADEQYVDMGLMPAPVPADVADALRPYVGDGEVYVPAGIGNKDHVRVRDAVLPVWPGAVLYADLPYTLRDGWELPENLPRRETTHVVLDESVAAAKLDAVRAYETQVAHLESIFGDFVTADGLGRERFWRPGA
jgi:LmbE family N-acetylglucosaminyl deacetylase